jgi:hypothetical protein
MPRHSVADVPDIACQGRITEVFAALHLLRREILLIADRNFFFGRNDCQLPLTGDRVDRAGLKQQRRGQGENDSEWLIHLYQSERMLVWAPSLISCQAPIESA